MTIKSKWSALFTTQFLGVLNDNLLKNLIVFISAYWVAEKEVVISIATALLVLPFLLFSSLAGRWAQMFRKAWIVERAKLAEIPIMMLSITGFYTESIHLVLISLLLMGLQSTIYSPSKYGLIRDVGGKEGLSFGTGTMELLTFLGVLIGTFVAGTVSDMGIMKNHILSGLLILFAVTGWISSKSIKVTESKVSQPEDSLWPHRFIIDSYKWAQSIKGLNYTILGLGAFWFIGSMLQMAVIVHMPDANIYGFSNTHTSFVMAGMAVGIGLGCWVSGLISRHRVETGMVPLGGLGMSICITILGFATIPAWAFIALITLTAFFSGFFKVPLNAWIQERVEGRKLGQILAYNNNILFLFILVSAALFALITKFSDTYMVFKVVAFSAWAITAITLVNIPGMMSRFMLITIGRLFYKVNVTGIENIPAKGGALLVANHVSIVDFILVSISIPRSVRFVMMREIYEKPLIKWWFKRLNMLPVPAGRDADALLKFRQLCQAEIQKGHVVCIFPEGQISRNGHLLEFKKGMEHIAHEINAPIIPMHIDGIQGYSWTYDITTGRLRKPGMRINRREVLVNVGEAHLHCSAFRARQLVTELASHNFSQRINGDITLPGLLLRNKSQGTPLIFGESPDATYSDIWRMASWLQKQSTSGVKLSIHSPALMAKWLLASQLARITPVIDHKVADNTLQIDGKTINLNAIESPKTGKSFKPSGKSILPGIQVYDEDNHQQIHISANNVVASLLSSSEVFDHPATSRIMTLLPVASTWFAVNSVFNAVYRQFELVAPNNIVEAGTLLQEAKPDVLLASADQVKELFHQDENVLSHGLQRIITGSEPIDDDIKQVLVKKHNIEIYQSLGFTACGPLVALSTPDLKTSDLSGNRIIQRGMRIRSVGRAIPGMAIQLRDRDDQSIIEEANQPGQLWVKGATVSNDNSDWHNTGAIVKVDNEGFIWVE